MKLDSRAVQLIMARKKLPLKIVAETGGMTAQGISNAIRSGRATPATVGKIAEGLGVSVTKIILDETDDQPNSHAAN